jgi:hypothetical protein
VLPPLRLLGHDQVGARRFGHAIGLGLGDCRRATRRPHVATAGRCCERNPIAGSG